MVRLTFYYKEGCWLCVMAEEMLNGLKLRYNINIKKVEITSDPETYELFRYDIPALEFKDGSALFRHIRKKELLRKLEENRE